MKKILSILVCLLIITGCSQAKEKVESETANDASTTDSLDDTFYSIIKLDVNSDREGYYTDLQRTIDYKTVDRELSKLSIPHFSTSTYYKAEGQYLTKDNRNQLLLRNDDPTKYPDTLQPLKGTEIEGILNPIMIGSIYEQDFYKQSGSDYVISGVSFGIVIDPKHADNTSLVTPMADSEIEKFGHQTIEKFYNYIKDKKTFKDIPINICIFQASNNIDSSVDGRYILSSYCDGSLGTIENQDYKNLIFTSSEAESYDIETATEFSAFKTNMKKAALEAIGVIGYGRYQDGDIQSLKIELNANTKTYSELEYIVSKAAEELDHCFSLAIRIVVVVSTQDGEEAFITKQGGQDAESVLLY